MKYPTYWRRQLKYLFQGRGFCRTCLYYPFACPKIHWSKKQRARIMKQLEEEGPLFIRGEDGKLIRNPNRLGENGRFKAEV